ncbi:MAG: hypothetical protein M0Z55_13550 [Peptococcaceae bacterium]|nr:hypothetical protein [Peptococcaceae bacterium]
MFNARKPDHFPGNPGKMGIIVATLVIFLLVGSVLSFPTAPLLIATGLVLFALWWLYDKYLRKPTAAHDEQLKYHKAVSQQKKAKSTGTAPGRGKVVYLSNFKRK